MSDQIKTYTIGGKIYEQRELCYAQIQLLINLLKDVEFTGELTYARLLSDLGFKLMPALSIVLNEQGQPLPRKADPAHRDELAEELSYSITADTIAEVIADFFTLTPVERIITLLAAGMQHLVAMRSGANDSPPESSDKSSSSVTETSPAATPSVGASDPPPQSPG